MAYRKIQDFKSWFYISMILILTAHVVITSLEFVGHGMHAANQLSLIGSAFAAEPPKPESPETIEIINYSYSQIALALIALVLLGVIFYLVIVYC